MTFSQWEEGVDAHEKGEQLDLDWPTFKQKGWRFRERVILEAVAQATAPTTS